MFCHLGDTCPEVPPHPVDCSNDDGICGETEICVQLQKGCVQPCDGDEDCTEGFVCKLRDGGDGFCGPQGDTPFEPPACLADGACENANAVCMRYAECRLKCDDTTPCPEGHLCTDEGFCEMKQEECPADLPKRCMEGDGFYCVGLEEACNPTGPSCADNEIECTDNQGNPFCHQGDVCPELPPPVKECSDDDSVCSESEMCVQLHQGCVQTCGATDECATGFDCAIDHNGEGFCLPAPNSGLRLSACLDDGRCENANELCVRRAECRAKCADATQCSQGQACTSDGYCELPPAIECPNELPKRCADGAGFVCVGTEDACPNGPPSCTDNQVECRDAAGNVYCHAGDVCPELPAQPQNCSSDPSLCGDNEQCVPLQNHCVQFCDTTADCASGFECKTDANGQGICKPGPDISYVPALCADNNTCANADETCVTHAECRLRCDDSTTCPEGQVCTADGHCEFQPVPGCPEAQPKRCAAGDGFICVGADDVCPNDALTCADNETRCTDAAGNMFCHVGDTCPDQPPPPKDCLDDASVCADEEICALIGSFCAQTCSSDADCPETFVCRKDGEQDICLPTDPSKEPGPYCSAEKVCTDEKSVCVQHAECRLKCDDNLPCPVGEICTTDGFCEIDAGGCPQELPVVCPNQDGTVRCLPAGETCGGGGAACPDDAIECVDANGARFCHVGTECPVAQQGPKDCAADASVCADTEICAEIAPVCVRPCGSDAGCGAGAVCKITGGQQGHCVSTTNGDQPLPLCQSDDTCLGEGEQCHARAECRLRCDDQTPCGDTENCSEEGYCVPKDAVCPHELPVKCDLTGGDFVCLEDGKTCDDLPRCEVNQVLCRGPGGTLVCHDGQECPLPPKTCSRDPNVCEQPEMCMLVDQFCVTPCQRNDQCGSAFFCALDANGLGICKPQDDVSYQPERCGDGGSCSVAGDICEAYKECHVPCADDQQCPAGLACSTRNYCE